MITLTELHARQQTQALMLLDIREAEELAVLPTIPGATHMPMGKVFTEVAKEQLPKDKPIVVFCMAGGRAAVVERELRERGYTIDGLEGGLRAIQATPAAE